MHRRTNERRLRLAVIAFALLLSASAVARGASAQEFNPHLIISDQEMRDSSAMTLAEIEAFLKAKGRLGEVFDLDAIDGLLKSAPQLIYDAAHRYSINPKYILVLLQKESGVVESAGMPAQSRLDWAAGYALCDGCYKSSATAQKNKGFAKQVDAGAGWMDWFFKTGGTLSYLARPGVTQTVGGRVSVTPANVATAALYSYTPHFSGNKLFFSIWNRWFGQVAGVSTDVPAAPKKQAMPDGAVIRNAKNGAAAVVQGGLFRPIMSQAVLVSRFASAPTITLSAEAFEAAMAQHRGTPVKFADFSLVKVEDGTTYLLVGPTRRKIASPAAFSQNGFNPEEVDAAAMADIAEYAEGPVIAENSPYVAPKLVQDPRTGGVFVVADGIKRPLWDKALLVANFPGLKATLGTAEDLDKLPTGDPLPFAEGALIKSADSATVYLISGGRKRAIPDEATFKGFGLSFAKVLTVSIKALALNENGEPLQLPELSPSSPLPPVQTTQS